MSTASGCAVSRMGLGLLSRGMQHIPNTLNLGISLFAWLL